ncbi:MAG: transposase [Planctomycetota bacterium]|jgi:putative transposase
MPRLARVVAPGLPHHITARGNFKEAIFSEAEDWNAYRGLLAGESRRTKVTIQAYCLMGNHIHLVATPAEASSLASMMATVQRGYAEYFNTRFSRRGHLWEERYYSCLLDEPHLWAAVRYVENNPVRAGLVPSAERYPWSSAAHHAGLSHDALLDSSFPPPGTIEDWLAWLQQGCGKTEDRLRTETGRCRALGTPAFLRRVGEVLGRDLTPRKRGRPKADPEKNR